MTISKFPDRPDYAATLFGPDQLGSSLIVDGRIIPNIVVHDRGDFIQFVLDSRMAFEFPRDFAINVAAFAANAMAIGAGYAFIGSESRERPFAPQVFGIELP